MSTVFVDTDVVSLLTLCQQLAQEAGLSLVGEIRSTGGLGRRTHPAAAYGSGRLTGIREPAASHSSRRMA
jgi:hypothetical protein